jgi:hypothetical protein
MQRRCLDIASISRYLHHLAELEDVLHVEGHVGTCARCRDKLQRMQRYSEALFDDHRPGEHSEASCPSLIALEHFNRDGLSERQMIRIQEHLRSCAQCQRWAGARRVESERTERSPLLATRDPDLDVRVAPQGARVACGIDWLDTDAAPTLFQRLDLRQPELPQPYVAFSRQLHIRRLGPGWVIRGRIDLFGSEGFRLTLRSANPGTALELSVWTRARFMPRGTTEPDAWVLEPGHYFVGPSGYESPLLALCIDGDILTAASLAACAYDACRFGHFRRALQCFEHAIALEPATQVYRTMHAETLEFARRFGLARADGTLHWRAPKRRKKPTSVPRLDLRDAAPEETNARIADLVGQLREQAEADAAAPAGSGTILSRRPFAARYAPFMAALRAALPSADTSVPFPIRAH